MRLIDADKLEVYSSTVPEGNDPESYMNGMTEVLEYIDSMPTYIVTATNVNWIPVIERLPENTGNGEVYLVTCKFKQKNGSFGYDVNTAFFTNNLHELDSYDFPYESQNRPGWYDYDSETGFYEIDIDISKVYGRQVVAWMPLPKPYEEAKDGN